jgi:hypothetical protein
LRKRPRFAPASHGKSSEKLKSSIAIAYAFAKNNGLAGPFRAWSIVLVNAAQMSLKSIRIIHIVFLLTVALYIWLPPQIVNGEAMESPLFFVVVFAMVSLTSVVPFCFFRPRWRGRPPTNYG